jgi:ATPase family associated with various cellular activities (AAA)
MKTASNRQEFSTFSPNLLAQDDRANYWMGQVTIRLRREICWRWYQQSGENAVSNNLLPLLEDSLIASLNLTRHWQEKCHFFQTDPTAKYLTDKLAISFPIDRSPLRGSFGWVVDTLGLDEISAFILALGLIGSFDRAAGTVIAACLNDATATQPNLALAQLLWDEPEQVLAIADPNHPLWRYGLLQPANSTAMDWHSPIVVSPPVTTCLLFPTFPLPQVLEPISETENPDIPIPEPVRLVALRLQTQSDKQLRIVPIRGVVGSSATEILQGISQITHRRVVELQSNAALLENSSYLKSLVTLCWLQGFDLWIRSNAVSTSGSDTHRPHAYLLPLQSIPIAIFLEIRDRSELTHLPNSLLLPIVDVPPLSYCDRVHYWHQCLGTTDTSLNREIAESSRRFRYEKETIRTICEGLKGIPLSETTLITACRAELDLDIGELAQEVTPRFEVTSLVLPPKQQRLFAEIYQAMKALTEVHYGWGTARVWNESGISVLFAGPPGTGKTMAAEVLATQLDLPMYRIDLSQVVNKYIGETEKNLKRLFDLADISDTILFFDEADALFGRRTEVKDAHDRYANLEISYLLERMERFKGLAILATNRKKDLDEAFLRRLRYILDFPLPDVAERKRIWLQVMPDKVDTSQLDFDFLARQFPLAGGHIRSIVFNACLQTADGSTLPQLTMERVIIAVKREYDKLNRSVSLEQFGAYARLVEGMDRL